MSNHSPRFAPRVMGALSAALLSFTASIGAQGQSQGVPDRVSTLESQVAVLMQQVAALEPLTSQVATLQQQVAVLQQLMSQVSALQQHVWDLRQVTSRDFQVTVDCGNGETVAGALAQTNAHLGLVTINVRGVCTENIIVSRSPTRIRGLVPGAGITAAIPAQPVLQFGGIQPAGHTLVMSDLTISGGSNGLVADRAQRVQLTNVVIKNNQTGIRANHESFVSVSNSIIELNGFGIDAVNGAHVSILGGAIQNNNNYGLQLQGGAVADVTGTLIKSNTNGGGGANSIRGAVGLYQGSTLRLNATHITQNSGNGVFAVFGSTVWLSNGTVIDQNGGNGVYLMDASVAGKFFVETDININNNGGYGIKCSPSPAVPQLYGFPNAGSAITTTGNAAGTISCPAAPPS
jgi:Right handed beta helix region